MRSSAFITAIENEKQKPEGSFSPIFSFSLKLAMFIR